MKRGEDFTHRDGDIWLSQTPDSEETVVSLIKYLISIPTLLTWN